MERDELKITESGVQLLSRVVGSFTKSLGYTHAWTLACIIFRIKLLWHFFMALHDLGSCDVDVCVAKNP